MSDTDTTDFDPDLEAAKAAYAEALATTPSVRPGSAPEPSAHDADAVTRAAAQAAELAAHDAAWTAAIRELADLQPLLERALADQDVEPNTRQQLGQAVDVLRRDRARHTPEHLMVHVNGVRAQMEDQLAKAENARADRARQKRDEAASLRARAEAEARAKYRPDLGEYDAASLIAEAEAIGIRLSVHPDTGGLAYVAPPGVEMPALLRDRLRQIAGSVCLAITPRLV